MVYSVVFQQHLVGLVSHGFRLKPIVKSSLNSNVYTVIFVRIGNVVEAYLLAVYSDHILTISEDHDVVLEIFSVKRVFLYKVRQLLLGYESGLLEKC